MLYGRSRRIIEGFFNKVVIMAKYKIPDAFISAYQILSKISIETVSILSKELEQIRIGANPDEILETLVKSNKIELPKSELEPVIEAIFSSYGLINREGQHNIQNVINDLVESFCETPSNENNHLNLKSNLQQLLKVGSRLDLTHKTFQLLSDYDKIYINSRIISDVRIIFNDDLKNSNQEAAIVHQLKMEYHERGEVKNMFFALDINDLEDIKEHINRAIEKEKLIRDNTYKNLSFISLKNN